MTLRYKCLILDHDDTAVKSTPDIHYPSFVQALKELRPDDQPITFEEFVRYCFAPGFSALCTDIMQFTETKQNHQQKIWKHYTESTTPNFYELFPETVQEFAKQGGIVTVISHSESSKIKRDYATHCNVLPDAIFGWELAEHQRKPHPYPIKQILDRYNLAATDALVLDDLKPGMTMVKSCNLDFAAAGWSHKIPETKQWMEANSDYYFGTVEEFRDFIFV